jgi:NADP-dependent aldehyde dehydrogenase
MKEAYENGLHLTNTFQPEIQIVASGTPATTFTGVQPVLYSTKATYLLANKQLATEIFGPTSVVVQAEHLDELLAVAHQLEGHLTASIFGTSADLKANQALIDILQQKVGRLIINGYPTGVEVCHSMVHGGPFPATTVPASTSVGTNAIYRFTRPVCFQGFPDEFLPEALQASNPLQIHRKINGILS